MNVPSKEQLDMICCSSNLIFIMYNMPARGGIIIMRLLIVFPENKCNILMEKAAVIKT